MAVAIAHTAQAKRIGNDQYFTPWWMPWVLMKYVRDVRRATAIFDPCSGEGSILRVFRQYGFPKAQLLANEPDASVVPDNAEFELIGAEDASLPASWNYWSHLDILQEGTWVVSNLPYQQPLVNHILERILEAHRAGPVNVALLFRATFIEPTKTRESLLEACPPTALIKMPRYCWRRGTKTGKWQTDACCHEWVIWSHQPVTAKPITVVPEARIPGYYRNPELALPCNLQGLQARQHSLISTT